MSNNSNSRDSLQEAFTEFTSEEFQDILRNTTTDDIDDLERIFMELYGSYDGLSADNKKLVEGLVMNCLRRIDTSLKGLGNFKMGSMLNALNDASSSSNVNMNSNINMKGGKKHSKKSRKNRHGKKKTGKKKTLKNRRGKGRY